MPTILVLALIMALSGCVKKNLIRYVNLPAKAVKQNLIDDRRRCVGLGGGRSSHMFRSEPNLKEKL